MIDTCATICKQPFIGSWSFEAVLVDFGCRRFSLCSSALYPGIPHFRET
jgi:hypothetical protein